LISSQLQLHRLSTGRESRISTALTMLKQMLWRYQGHVSAALILGGVDNTGAGLYTVYPHGSTDRLPFVTMGSGSMAAMAMFEARYKPGMERQEAIDLVHDAICSGIFNDLGSGSNVDITVLTKGKTDVLRNYARPNERMFRSRVLPYSFPPGTTPVIKTQIIPLEKRVEITTVSEEATSTDRMDVS
jgi:20S proteasome subunit beta 2